MDRRLEFPFRKVHRAFVLVDGLSWCSVTVLAIEDRFHDRSNEEVIDALIKSPYHLWQGEINLGGMEWTWNGEKLHVEQFGPWDRTRITAKDYSPIPTEQGLQLLMDHLKEHIEADEKELQTAGDLFRSEVPANYTLYHLTLRTDHDQERKVVNKVFDHFIAFIGLDRSARRALVFEAGMD